VSGALPRGGDFEVPMLEALRAEDVRFRFREEEHEYRGLNVERLLRHCGFDAGPGGRGLAPQERRSGWRKLVIARRDDGFAAIFTVAELAEEMGPSRACIAWQRHGSELPIEEGPLRLVVTADRKGSRSVRALRELELVDIDPAPRGSLR
jgi:hypothetical protein